MESGSKPFYSDHEIICDRDGIPHFTGVQSALMKEYRRRVLFAWNSLEGEGDTPEKEASDLNKKRRRFASRLLNALHGEAWKAVEHLVAEQDELKKPDGYKAVLAALQTIEKEGIIRKTEAFDRFFEATVRRKGEAIDSYLRKKIQAWQDLKDLDESSAMSEDLLSYHLLKGCSLSRDDRRAILLANKSSYTRAGIEQALRISYHDLHEREKTSHWKNEKNYRGGGHHRRSYAVHEEDGRGLEESEAVYEIEDDAEDYEHGEQEEEEAYEVGEARSDGQVSDAGASNDGEIYEAYAAMNQVRQGYREARKKLRDVQKARGFYKGPRDDRRQTTVEQEKKRTRCGACHRIGHWAGDPECPKSSSAGPGSGKSSKGKSKRKPGRGRSASRAAYAVAPMPLLFNLGEEEFDDDDGFCHMVTGHEEDEDGSMVQDAGYTETDDRRKTAAKKAEPSESAWSCVDPPYPEVNIGGIAIGWGSPEVARGSGHNTYAELSFPESPGRVVQQSQEIIQPKLNAQVEVREVASFQEVKPTDLDKMKVRDLQAECDRWGIQTGGLKRELLERLQDLFSGKPVPKKNCSVQFVRLVQEDDPGPLPCPQTAGPSDRGAEQVTTSVRAVPKASTGASRDRPIRLSDLTEGAPLGTMPCFLCGFPMVLRRNRTDGGYFFSCSMFPRTKCRFTRPLVDGLAILNGEAEMGARFPRGSN